MYQRDLTILTCLLTFLLTYGGFVPRDAMHKRGLRRRAVSVCLSVTFMYCVQTSNHILKLFSPPGRPTTLAFRYVIYAKLPIFRRGRPLLGASNAREYEKLTICFTSILLYLGNDTKRGHSYYGTPVGTQMRSISNGGIFYDFERLLFHISRSRHYLTLNILETVRGAYMWLHWNTDRDLHMPY